MITLGTAIAIVAIISIVLYEPLMKYLNKRFKFKTKRITLGFISFWLLLILIKIIYKVPFF